jgi:hypothetical protein
MVPWFYKESITWRDAISFVQVPIVEKPVIYLDHNVFSKAARDFDFKATLVSLIKTEKYIFPYTQVHIAELNRITSNRKEEIESLLSTIKEISCSNYLEYREGIRSYTIRPRDPHEVFETINDVPQSYIDEISKLATDQHLRPQLTDLPENCFRMENQFKFFVERFRSQFPNLGREINNMSKAEAKKHLEEKVFGMPFKQAFELLEKSQKGSGIDIKSLTVDFFIENTLFLAGYKTPNKDLKKPGGLLSDHQHLNFARNCPIIISDDENFRRKALECTEANLVTNSIRGINFLLVHSGLVNLVAEHNGESLNQKYLDACLLSTRPKRDE